MTLLLLEAFGAMAVLILIVWWTMFSGRKKGERRSVNSPSGEADAPPSKEGADRSAAARRLERAALLADGAANADRPADAADASSKDVR